MGFLFMKAKNEDLNECIIQQGTNYLVPGEIVEKLSETIVRIENENIISTGFFIKINIQEINHNFLLTCAHSISQEDINSKKIISIYYGKKGKEIDKKIELDKNKRFIKCFFDDNIDATIIEILPEDDIPKDKYLYPDLNYANGFDIYIEEKTTLYTSGYPYIGKYKGEKHYSGGEVTGIRYINENNYYFFHNCSTKEGSSGSPLINDNKQVIGIHYGCNKKKTMNYGVFVGAIIDILNNKNKKNETNFNSKKVKRNIKIEVKKVDSGKKVDDGDEIKEIYAKEHISENAKISEIEDIKPKSKIKLIKQTIDNLPFLSMSNILLQDEKMKGHLNNMKDIQQLKKENPILNEAFNNPKLMKKIINPEVADTINDMLSIINKNKNQENNNIDDPIIFEKKFNQLKNMGFKNDNLIREALLLFKGNIEEAKQYISSADKKN